MYFNFPKILSETFVIPRRIKQVIIINSIGIHLKYPSLSDFNETWIFSSEMPYLMKNRQVGAEMFHADGQAYKQTDNTTKLIVVFRNCSKGPKISGAVGKKIVKNYQATRRHKPEDNYYWL